MKTKEGFELRTVCGENVLMAQGLSTIDFGKLIHFNDTAAYLWQEANRQGSFTAATLAKALCGEYEVSEQQALADVERMLTKWKNEGIVED